MMLTEVLTGEGYHPLPCAGGASAVALDQTARPALVILDLYLGGVLDASAGVTRLRQQVATADLPVLICLAAGPALTEATPWLRAQGCVALHTPFRLDELLALIAALVAGRDVPMPAPDAPPGSARLRTPGLCPRPRESQRLPPGAGPEHQTRVQYL